MEIKKIGVLGAGIMGAGIAQICAEAGYEVILVDVAESFVNKGFQGIVKN
ncbi:MAG: 3-hydroxyacyl-CoA dehydrogenase NAD-binding domain-containing protein [Bacillota bacterium]